MLKRAWLILTVALPTNTPQAARNCAEKPGVCRPTWKWSSATLMPSTREASFAALAKFAAKSSGRSCCSSFLAASQRECLDWRVWIHPQRPWSIKFSPGRSSRAGVQEELRKNLGITLTSTILRPCLSKVWTQSIQPIDAAKLTGFGGFFGRLLERFPWACLALAVTSQMAGRKQRPTTKIITAYLNENGVGGGGLWFWSSQFVDANWRVSSPKTL